MRYYEIDTGILPQVVLLGKETLLPPRKHLTRSLSEHVLYVMIHGMLDLEVNNSRIRLVPGDICLFDIGDTQEPLSEDFCEYYYVHLCADSIRHIEMTEEEYGSYIHNKLEMIGKTDFYSPKCYDYLKVIIGMKSHIGDEQVFAGIKERLQTYTLSSSSRFPQKRFHTSAVVADIFLTLENQRYQSYTSRVGNPVKIYETVRKISEYIGENYASKITGIDIEERFFLSFDYCNRIFRKVMGCSIIRYCNMVRIQHAKAIFRTTDRPIGDVAASVGFDSTYYFTRVFRKTEGLTPSEYKKKFMTFRTPIKEETEGQ